MSSKNSTVFLVQLAVYKDVLILLHSRAPDTITVDKIRVTLAVFKEEQVTKIGMQSTHLVARNSLIIFFKEKLNIFRSVFRGCSEHAQQSALKRVKTALLSSI